MRFALVIEPAGSPSTDPVDRLAPLRSAVARAGFNVVRLTAGPTLARDLARAIEVTDDDDSALVYLAGEVRLDGGQAVLTCEPPMAVADMAKTVAGRALSQLLFVMDARVEGETGDAMHAFEHVEAIVAAVSPKDRAMELLVAVESSPRANPPSFALTRFFVQAIEDERSLAADGTMHMSRAYAKMTAHPEFAPSVPSFAHVKGPSDFTVVAPVTERVSEVPPSRQAAPISGVTSTRTPWRARAVVPMPAIGPILAEAERAHKKGEWDAALDGYRKTLMLIGETDPHAAASIYASIAEVKLAQGKDREAEASFEKALGADPTHARSLAALTKRAIDAKDFRRAAGLERRLAKGLKEEGKRIEAYARSAELYENAGDLRTAIEVLEEARTLRPTEPALLAALRAGYEALKQWKKLVEVLGVMAESAPLLHDKAQRRFEQADVLLGRLRDEQVGLAVLASALEEDPTHERALGALVAVHARREEWRAIEALYQRLIDVFAQREDAMRAWEICRKLGQLRRDKLGDGPGALEAFTAAVKLRPKDVETRAALAELLVAKGDRDAAIGELEIVARVDPARAETHRRLFDLHRRIGATDRAWLAATALEALGAANTDQGLLANQFRDETKPLAVLGDAGWSLLRSAAIGSDPVIQAITEAIAPAAVRVKLGELRAEKKLLLLDLEKRQPKTSTATLVRTFGMVANLLGVTPPDLYAQDGADMGLTAVQAEEPSTLFGSSLTTGRKLPELSFVVARHLVYYRPEHYVLLFYPTLPELTALVLAAVKIARPELPLPISPLSVRLRRELVKYTTEAEKNALAVAVEQLDARGGKVDLTSWLTGVEVTANRAGLLVCGDLAVAIGMMRSELRSTGELTFEDRRSDLIAFTASRALAELRVLLGIAVRTSLPPPPPSGMLPES